MLIIRNPSDLPRIANPAIRQLVALRFQQLAPSAAPATPGMSPDGYFVVVEAGDAVSEIEQAVGFPVLSGLFDDLPYTDPDFQPCHELLEEHQHEQDKFYEMVFISDDDGTATAIFVPDAESIDADLLAMCRSFATPAMSKP